MPQSPGRRTAAPRRRPADARRDGGPRRRGNDSRNSPAPRRPVTRHDEVTSELDRALAAALEVPAPPPITFRELGLAPALVTALATRGIEMPFAIQARALPDALAGRDVLGRAQTG
jgi:hypothetical protein